MKTESDTRKRILDLAEALLLSHGFNAFSYQQVSRELGVRNAAIHYHFPHKTDLGVALVERYRRRLSRFVAAQSALAPREQLERYFSLAFSYFQHDKQVCPSGMLCTEFPLLPEAMRAQALAFIDEMRVWSIALARHGRETGVFDYPGEAEEMGMLMCAALQGAVQLARVDEGWLDGVKRQIERLLGVD